MLSRSLRLKIFILFGCLLPPGLGFCLGDAIYDFDKCLIGASGNHPEIRHCYERQIDYLSQEIETKLSASHNDETLNRVVNSLHYNQSQWGVYVRGVCAIYLELGGQRGELLQLSCAEKKYQERRTEINVLLEQAEL